MRRQVWSAPHLRMHLTQEIEAKEMCRVAQYTLDPMNGPVNSLLEFHCHRQPKPSLFISSHIKWASANVQTSCCFKFQSGHFSVYTLATLLNIGRVTRKWIRLAKALQQFLCRKPSCWVSHSREMQKMSLVPLRRCDCCVANQICAFPQDCSFKQSHLWNVWLILLEICWNCFK